MAKAAKNVLRLVALSLCEVRDHDGNVEFSVAPGEAHTFNMDDKLEAASAERWQRRGMMATEAHAAQLLEDRAEADAEQERLNMEEGVRQRDLLALERKLAAVTAERDEQGARADELARQLEMVQGSVGDLKAALAAKDDELAKARAELEAAKADAGGGE